MLLKKKSGNKKYFLKKKFLKFFFVNNLILSTSAYLEYLSFLDRKYKKYYNKCKLSRLKTKLGLKLKKIGM